jgi:hypothetical protein
VGSRGSFPGGKAAGVWSWQLTSIQCRGQRMSGAIPPLPRYVSMAWCSVKKKRSTGTTLLLPSYFFQLYCMGAKHGLSIWGRNRVLKRICGPKREEDGSWRKLHNDADIFLTSWVTISFSNNVLHHGVSEWISNVLLWSFMQPSSISLLQLASWGYKLTFINYIMNTILNV